MSTGSENTSPLSARWRPLLLWAVPIALLGGAGYYLATHARYVSTDNAYAKSEMSEVAPEVSGLIREVRVRENTPVKAGEVMMVVAGPSLQIAATAAQAKLDLALTDLRSQLAARAQRMAMLAATARREDLPHGLSALHNGVHAECHCPSRQSRRGRGPDRQTVR